jgi:hypothetical protein
VIDGGAERWQNVTINKTSQEKLVALLNEFTGGGNDDDSSGNQAQNASVPDQLPPYGEGEQIPFHLRSSKSVKNRRLTRRDIAVLIQEIWTERRISDKQVYFSYIYFLYFFVLFRTVERKVYLNLFMNFFVIDMVIIIQLLKWVII